MVPRSRGPGPVVERPAPPGGPSDALSEGAATPRSGALVLHEGISHPDPRGRGCKRWPEGAWLLSSQGEMVLGRCKSTNQCDYCAKLGAVENTELLTLDALHGVAPTIYVCLTTRSATPEPRHFYRSRELLLRALRRRWPAAEVAWLLEFTTGYGKRSGGLRRPHWNGLLKGIPEDDLDQARDVIVGLWCSREDALPDAQEVSRIRDVGGLTTYIAAHFQKSSQAPPAGWRGHRFTKSRGYLWTDTPTAREAARRSLRERRELHRALTRGLDPHEAALAVHQALELADATTWRLLHLEPSQLVRRERDEARAALVRWVERGAGPPSPPVAATHGGREGP